MSGDGMSIEEIKALVDDYNVILVKYVAANKSLTDLGSGFDLKPGKTILGGTPSSLVTIPTVEACQAKCGDLHCAAASYNSNTKGCLIHTDTTNIQLADGTSFDSAIINTQVYYLNQLDNLNAQLNDINNKIIAKIATINSSDALTTLYNERMTLKEHLETVQSSLSQSLNNFTDNSNILDVEYIQQDAELATISNYYIFLLLAVICLIALILLVTAQL
jgi:hypothetical protein